MGTILQSSTTSRQDLSVARRLLLADDDGELRSLLARILRKDGYDVVEAADGAATFLLLNESRLFGGAGRPPDAIITDVRMPGFDGLQLLARIHAVSPATPVILMSGFPDHELLRTARELGACAVIGKPFDLESLRRTLRGLF